MNAAGPDPVPVAQATPKESVGKPGYAPDTCARGADLEEAAKKLESLFLGMLVKEMRKTLSEGFFGSGPGAGVYEGLFDDLLGEQLAAGPGTELRRAIMASWGAESAGDTCGTAAPSGEATGSDKKEVSQNATDPAGRRVAEI